MYPAALVLSSTLSPSSSPLFFLLCLFLPLLLCSSSLVSSLLSCSFSLALSHSFLGFTFLCSFIPYVFPSIVRSYSPFPLFNPPRSNSFVFSPPWLFRSFTLMLFLCSSFSCLLSTLLCLALFLFCSFLVALSFSCLFSLCRSLSRLLSFLTNG